MMSTDAYKRLIAGYGCAVQETHSRLKGETWTARTKYADHVVMGVGEAEAAAWLMVVQAVEDLIHGDDPGRPPPRST